jgi:hypothetical protein
MPKTRDLSFFPRGIKTSGKLVNIVHRDLKWFAYIFKNNEIFSKLWDSVFVDGQERGDLGSFMDALPEHMYESDDDDMESENEDENNEPLDEDEISNTNDILIDSAIAEDVIAPKDDIKENQMLSVASPPTPQKLDLNQLISTAAHEYDVPKEEAGYDIESIFYPSLEKEIEGEDNSNGSSTIDRLRTLINGQMPEGSKQQADMLNRLFNKVFTMQWSNSFKFACMLVFNEKKELKNGDVTYIVLSEIELQLFSKFAANFDIRKEVLGSKKIYSQRIFNVA